MSNSPSTMRAQENSIATATNRGETWTCEDVEFVRAFEDEAHADLAATLNRTIYSIDAIKAAIRNGFVTGAPAVTRPFGYRGWTEADGDGW